MKKFSKRCANLVNLARARKKSKRLLHFIGKEEGKMKI
jgi:hypothetical protein